MTREQTADDDFFARLSHSRRGIELRVLPFLTTRRQRK